MTLDLLLAIICLGLLIGFYLLHKHYTESERNLIYTYDQALKKKDDAYYLLAAECDVVKKKLSNFTQHTLLECPNCRSRLLESTPNEARFLCGTKMHPQTDMIQYTEACARNAVKNIFEKPPDAVTL